MRLKDKIAIVTGAANGIGRGIAEMFAQEGASVLIVDIEDQAGEETAAALRARGLVASFAKVDVSDQAQVQAAVRMVGEKQNRIDVLVNNAAYIKLPWHAVETVTDEEWEKSFRVGMMGTQYFTAECLKYMLPHKTGSIINISSVQGMVASRNSVAYASIKHGLIGFTKSVAFDYGPMGIRSNAVCPGAIRTRISPEPGSDLHKLQCAKTFLGRTGDVKDIAYACVYLASDESAYVTGAILPVDGGWTCM